MALAKDLRTSVRIDLVVAHCLTAHYGFGELSWNHISGRVSKTEYLVTPGDRHYDMLMASDLVGRWEWLWNVSLDRSLICLVCRSL